MLVAAHLDLPGVQEFEELADGGAAPWGERQTVAVAPEPLLRVLQFFVRELLVRSARRAAPPGGVPGAARPVRARRREGGGPRTRIVQHVRQSSEAFWVEVPRRDRHRGRLAEGPEQVVEGAPGAPARACYRPWLSTNSGWVIRNPSMPGSGPAWPAGAPRSPIPRGKLWKTWTS